MRLLAALLASVLAASSAAATGYAQLLPVGEFKARDGRPGPGKTWTLSESQGQALAAEMTAIAQRTPIAIDYDHHTLVAPANGALARASGWIHSVEWRPLEGLFAKVEWTEPAKALILSGEYRYISPVIAYDEATGEITGVLMASLVNLPALLDMEPVRAALAAFAAAPEGAAALNKSLFKPPHAGHSTENTVDLLTALIALLGLPAGATSETALTAIQTLHVKAQSAGEKAALPAALATALALPAGADEQAALSAITALKQPESTSIALIGQLQAQLAALQSQVHGDRLTQTVDAAIADHKLLPAMRDWAMDLGKRDFASLSTYIKAAAVMNLDGQSGAAGTQGAAGAAGAGPEATALSAQILKAFRLTPEQFAAAAPKAH